MGRHAWRYIQLSDDDRSWLEHQWKQGSSHSTRSRAHAILLSSQRYSQVQISNILGVTYETVENWLNRWDEHRRDGIADSVRMGRPPKLGPKDQNILCEIVLQHPQEPTEILEQLRQRTKKIVSRTTLRRVLRSLGFRWKRLRRSLKNHRDPQEFAIAADDLEAIAKLPNIQLVYFDEANFSISGVVSYAWQAMGMRTEIPISGGHRNSIQVLGFMSAEGKVKTYLQRSTVRGATVVKAINDFVRTIRRTTVLVLDNASPHTCREVANHIERWAHRGLILYNLPPYSPELNAIEHLWRKLKHQLIPANAWETIEKLRKHLIQSLSKLGTVKALEPMPAV